MYPAHETKLDERDGRGDRQFELTTWPQYQAAGWPHPPQGPLFEAGAGDER